MKNIGYLYFFGNGVPASREMAYTWLRKAAAAGSQEAAERLAVIDMPLLSQ